MQIIKTIQTEKRLYQVAETEVGHILFYELGDYIQYRNLTEKHVLWSIAKKFDFHIKFNGKVVETFQAERLTGMETITQIKSGDTLYYLARTKPYDGYVYEINASMQRMLKHPKRKFTYTRYYEPAVQTLDLLSVERLKIEETTNWNGHTVFDMAAVSSIVAEVYRLAKEAPALSVITNPLGEPTNFEDLEQLSLFE